jgi:hypothetical protein
LHQFTKKELTELYLYESKGIGKVDKLTNGFAYGKWARDLDVSMIIEDVVNGYACKYEFLSTPIERIHNTAIFKNVISGEFFPYRFILNDKNAQRKV